MSRFPSPSKIARSLTILILLVFCLSLGYLLVRPRFSQSRDLTAYVYHNGILIKKIPLSLISEPSAFTVEGESGSYNVIGVKPGSIAVISASCPDKLCVHQGYREDTLLPITCLPNHLVIRIAAGEETASDAMDAITY